MFNQIQNETMKTLKRITVLMAIMSFIWLQSFAQNVSASSEKQNLQGSQTSTNLTPGKFVDNNKDGVCDNYQARVKNSQGRNFVDKNGDGICDNRQNAGKGQGNGNCCGNGYGYQHRHGRK